MTRKSRAWVVASISGFAVPCLERPVAAMHRSQQELGLYPIGSGEQTEYSSHVLWVAPARSLGV